ncbi:MAG: hypothetical protein U5N56_10180 [Candidatus Marinimicrobia bacterium]|nr:hypothetical protein [Candidatus Neomarinimicrobiota bacterium]
MMKKITIMMFAVLCLTAFAFAGEIVVGEKPPVIELSGRDGADWIIHRGAVKS